MGIFTTQFFTEHKKAIAIIICIAILVTVFVGGFIFVNQRLHAKEYKKQLELARKYYAGMEYEQSIAAYKAANRAAPKETDAYIELATIYMEQSDTENAISTLQSGFGHSHSPQINLLLHKAINGSWQPVIRLLSKDKIDEISKNVRPDDSFLDILSKWTYGQYRKHYGSDQQKNVVGSTIRLEYAPQGIECSYYNTRENPDAVNMSEQVPEDDTFPNEIRLAGIGSIFEDFYGGVSYVRLEELFLGNIEKDYMTVSNDSEQIPVVIIHYKNLEITIETDQDGNIVNPQGYNKVTPIGGAASDEEEANNTVNGYVENAVTGEGVPCSFILYKGAEKTAEVDTGSDGSYSVKLARGNYVAEFSLEGFEKERIEFSVANASETVNFTISPALASGEIRIVLEWGSIPSDLDSHLLTPYGFDVHFRQKSYDRAGERIADLDLDDTSSYGPETTTIHNPSGKFRFSVHNYSGTGTFVGSDARVKVYLPGRAPVTFDGVPGNPGNWWHVFEIENGNIKTVNEVNDLEF